MLLGVGGGWVEFQSVRGVNLLEGGRVCFSGGVSLLKGWGVSLLRGVSPLKEGGVSLCEEVSAC